MITDEKKKRIESLTDEEMEQEISLGDKSRFQRDAFDHLKKSYQQRKRAKADSASKSYIRMLICIARVNNHYRQTIGSIVVGAIAAVGYLLQFDFSNLINEGIIPPETRKPIMYMGLSIIAVSFLLAFLLLNRYFLNKYKDPSKLSDEELDNLLKYL